MSTNLVRYPIKQIQNGCLLIVKNVLPTQFSISIPDGVYLLAYGETISITVTAIVDNVGFGLACILANYSLSNIPNLTENFLLEEDGPFSAGQTWTVTLGPITEHTFLVLGVDF